MWPRCVCGLHHIKIKFLECSVQNKSFSCREYVEALGSSSFVGSLFASDRCTKSKTFSFVWVAASASFTVVCWTSEDAFNFYSSSLLTVWLSCQLSIQAQPEHICVKTTSQNSTFPTLKLTFPCLSTALIRSKNTINFTAVFKFRKLNQGQFSCTDICHTQNVAVCVAQC